MVGAKNQGSYAGERANTQNQVLQSWPRLLMRVCQFILWERGDNDLLRGSKFDQPEGGRQRSTTEIKSSTEIGLIMRLAISSGESGSSS